MNYSATEKDGERARRFTILAIRSHVLVPLRLRVNIDERIMKNRIFYIPATFLNYDLRTFPWNNMAHTISRVLIMDLRTTYPPG